MSTDERVTKDLIATLEDGRKGFAQAAERLRDSGRSDLVRTFEGFATQRERFAEELTAMAAIYGDDIDENGTVAGTLHRGWMAIKDVLTGATDPSGVLDVAEQGEDHAVNEYEKALLEDISPNLRTIVERQFVDIKRAHAEVAALRTAATA